MLRLVRVRLYQLVCVLLLLSLLTFTLMKLAPGNPVLAILKFDEVAMTAADESALRQELGFDLPLYEQYGRWMWGLLQLNLGQSLMSGKPVWDEMMHRLPITLELTVGGMLVMVILALPLGLLAAKYAGRWPDHVSRLFALIGASMPSFWLGLILIYWFAFKLNWLPTMGSGSMRHLILPSVTLGFSMAAVYARLIRAGLLESLTQQYVNAARARGVAEWRIVTLHALRAALLPVITVFGMSLGNLLAGAVVVETLFSMPGLGSMAIEAIVQRDYPVIQGYVLLSGVFVVIVNLMVDLGYSLLDPRIRYNKEEM
ncbi:nickel ABC transporter permease [Paenibacillus sp. 481]|uniref:nickel ABC transporter permease n=1 Tax=Paenibacillus sp. 481 TaxID=2835869 RepID=UPI001E3520DC|nr:nickel ABC transporter permease [Paenibacillus sp. 481]UHA73628.1 ABC transporter permease [Paenibacillus sp. 481]